MEVIAIKDNDKIFYQYKIRVELNSQYSIFDADRTLSDREQKNNAVKRVFDYIKNRDTYIEFKSGNNDISVIKFQEASDSIILLQLAKRKSIGLTSKGESTFVDKKQDDYPWAIVIFDYKNQTLYVERAYKVYALPNEMIRIMENLFAYVNLQIVENTSLEFFVNIITSQDEFEACFKSFDLVSKVSIKLDSPNSFLGNREADELLSELRDETMAKQTVIEVSNDEGLYGEGIFKQFKAFIEYAVRGGGKWSIRGKCGNNKQITKSSQSKIKTLNINVTINNNSVENISEIADIVSKTNNYEE